VNAGKVNGSDSKSVTVTDARPTTQSLSAKSSPLSLPSSALELESSELASLVDEEELESPDAQLQRERLNIERLKCEQLMNNTSIESLLGKIQTETDSSSV